MVIAPLASLTITSVKVPPVSTEILYVTLPAPLAHPAPSFFRVAFATQRAFNTVAGRHAWTEPHKRQDRPARIEKDGTDNGGIAPGMAH
jgi:hypothetical protein